MAIRRAFRNMPRNPAELDRLFRDVDLPINEVTNATLRDSAACSVMGRSANSLGDPGDIVATANGQYLRRSGDALGFGAIEESDIPSTIARDADVSAAIAGHVAAVDPHPTYTTAAELASAIGNHEAALDPHPTYTTAAELSTAITALGLQSGAYTPTLTNVTNISASTPYECRYLRVLDVVHVVGRVDIDPAAAGATELGITLPIASNFTGNAQLCGVAASTSVAGLSAGIYSDAVNDRASLVFVAVDTANRDLFFSFSYTLL